MGNPLEKMIIEFFKKFNKPARISQVAKNLKINSGSTDYEDLKDHLILMVDEGRLYKSKRDRYSLDKFIINNTYEGIIKINFENGTILVDDEPFKKILIKRKHLNTALDGDLVEVKLLAFKKDQKARGEVLSVIDRNLKLINGTIEDDGYFCFLIPEEDNHYLDFIIPNKKMNGAKPGDKVACKLLHWDDPLKSPEVEVVKIVGVAGAPSVEFDSIVAEFSLKEDFPAKVIDESRVFPTIIPQKEIAKRLDLRDKEIVTIDPVDAKDFDDALSLEILPNGNRWLGVHIADVSHYVQEGSALDRDALLRGNSTYLVDRVVPMLPEILSNQICSLMPNKNRLAFSAFMEFDENCKIVNYEIKESVIKSKKRFSYEEALKVIEKGKGSHSELILNLHKLAVELKELRFKSGGINFETEEVKFILDENKQPIKANLKTSTLSTSLVEECMLIANKTIAGHINIISKKMGLNSKLPFLYRVHDVPVPMKMQEVIHYLKLITDIKSFNFKSSKDLNKFIELFDDRPEKPIVHQLLIRTMAKAEYSNHNIGHYGLGFKEYTHFTSPIRRYPDLIVHRLLKKYSDEYFNYKELGNIESKLKAIGEHTNLTERHAMEAERASTKLAQTILAQKFIGQEYMGTVSGVKNFGIFVVLDDIYAEGLLNMRDLHDDYYIYDEKRNCLTGRRKKLVFHFGKRIKVKINNVNVDKRKIDLLYINK